MMFDFPNAPTNGQQVTGPNGATYTYASATSTWSAATLTDNDARYVNVSGDTLTGTLMLNGDPSAALQAATKQYVDGRVADTGDTMTGALALADGAIATPSLTFGSQTTLGFYKNASNVLGFASSSGLRATFANTGVAFTVPLALPVGAVGTPSLYFTGDTDTGLYWVSADSIGFSTGGGLRLTLATAAATLAVPLVVSGSFAGDAVRITQTGAGNALVVEDSANPDATPFSVDTSGAVAANAITAVGNITISKTQPQLLLDSTSDNTGFVTFLRQGANRWLINTFSTEPGDGTGKDLRFTAYNDAASVATVVMHMERGTQNVTIGTQTFSANPARLNIRSLGAAADEMVVHAFNPSVDTDASNAIRFSTGTVSSPRAIIRGKREAATANGALTFSTFVGTTESVALTIGSDKIPVWSADQIRISTTKTPASATATGVAGSVCWDASYIYVCTATNTWRRAAISSW
jgi:hypothetical protein